MTHPLGLDVRRYLPPAPVPETPMQAKRRRLLREQDIDTVLDVGGNRGEYGQEMRVRGHRGRIASFEPLSEVFPLLTRAAQGDPDWQCVPVALGAESGTAEIHIAANLDSSSFLPMGDIHLHAAPFTAYRDVETVTVKTLDGLRDELGLAGRRLWLKLDVQGYELHVLRGAPVTLAGVYVVETELSYVSLYDGQPLLSDMFAFLHGAGFDLVLTEDTLRDPDTGHVLQVDALFVRRTQNTGRGIMRILYVAPRHDYGNPETGRQF